MKDGREIRVLVGWKQIEDHLGMQRRTIVGNDFPVRKGKLGGAYALTDELEEHLRAMPLWAESQKKARP